MLIGASLCSDQELIVSAQKGDMNAYGDLVTRYRAGVVNVVYRMCGDEHLSEEAAQDAFLRAWQRLSSYNHEYSFRAWVYRIAINAAIDVLRRERRLMGLDEEAEEKYVDDLPGPERRMEERERVEEIRRAVLSLSPSNRSVLVLREYGGMSYAEIASALNIPLGTVMSRLNSARGQLRLVLTGVLEVV